MAADISMFQRQALVPGTTEEVIVSHAESADLFYVRKAEDSQILSQLIYQMKNVYENPTMPPLTKEDVCKSNLGVIVCKNRNRWMRSQVLDVNIAGSKSMSFNVLYLDSGQTDAIKDPGQARSLAAEFLSFPILAIPCCLPPPSSPFEQVARSRKFSVDYGAETPNPRQILVAKVLSIDAAGTAVVELKKKETPYPAAITAAVWSDSNGGIGAAGSSMIWPRFRSDDSLSSSTPVPGSAINSPNSTRSTIMMSSSSRPPCSVVLPSQSQIRPYTHREKYKVHYDHTGLLANKLGSENFSGELEVRIVCVTSPCDFCIVPERWIDRFNEIQCEMDVYYEDLVQKERISLTESNIFEDTYDGQLCAARSKGSWGLGEFWARGLIQIQAGQQKDMTDSATALRVQFVDYGVEELIPRGNLRLLDQQFLDEPILGIRCFYDFPGSVMLRKRWSESLVEWMRVRLTKRNLVCQFRRYDEQTERMGVVLIEKSFGTGGDPFVSDIGAEILGVQSEESRNGRNTIPRFPRRALRELIPDRTRSTEGIVVNVTEFGGMDRFYVQLKEESEGLLIKVQKECHRVAEGSQKLELEEEAVERLKKVNGLGERECVRCLAVLTKDGVSQGWNRGEIIDVDQRKGGYSVFFVDFGCIVNCEASRIREAVENAVISLTPILAISCALTDKPQDNDIPPDAKRIVKDFLSGSSCSFVSVLSDGRMKVEMKKYGEDVSEKIREIVQSKGTQSSSSKRESTSSTSPAESFGGPRTVAQVSLPNRILATASGSGGKKKHKKKSKSRSPAGFQRFSEGYRDDYQWKRNPVNSAQRDEHYQSRDRLSINSAPFWSRGNFSRELSQSKENLPRVVYSSRSRSGSASNGSGNQSSFQKSVAHEPQGKPEDQASGNAQQEKVSSVTIFFPNVHVPPPPKESDTLSMTTITKQLATNPYHSGLFHGEVSQWKEQGGVSNQLEKNGSQSLASVTESGQSEPSMSPVAVQNKDKRWRLERGGYSGRPVEPMMQQVFPKVAELVIPLNTDSSDTGSATQTDTETVVGDLFKLDFYESGEELKPSTSKERSSKSRRKHLRKVKDEGLESLGVWSKKRVPCFCTSTLNSTGTFALRPTRWNGLYQNMQKDLREMKEQGKLMSLSGNKMELGHRALMSESEKKMHRVTVGSTPRDGVRVTLDDEGTTCKVNRRDLAFEIPDVIEERYHPFSVECRLAEVKPPGGDKAWPYAAKMWLNQRLEKAKHVESGKQDPLDVEFVDVYSQKKQHCIYSVKIFDETGESLTPALLSREMVPDLGPEIKEWSASKKGKEPVSVRLLSSSKGPDDVWVSVLKSGRIAGEWMDDMERDLSTPEHRLEAPKPGQFCVVKLGDESQRNRYFRGKVVKVNKDDLEVFDVDNGVTQTVTSWNAYTMRRKWTKPEQQAVNCRLKKPKGTAWSPNTAQHLLAMLEAWKTEVYKEDKWLMSVLESKREEKSEEEEGQNVEEEGCRVKQKYLVELRRQSDKVPLEEILTCPGWSKGTYSYYNT